MTVEQLIEILTDVEDKTIHVTAYVIDDGQRYRLIDVDDTIEGMIELNVN